MNNKIKPLDLKKDKRGRLVELIKPHDVGIDNFGQILMTSVVPGAKKGGHYHKRKKEWFVAISGKGEMKLNNVKNKETEIVKLDSNKPVLLQINPYWLHTIYNTFDKELILVIYITEEFNPKDPDTYYL